MERNLFYCFAIVSQEYLILFVSFLNTVNYNVKMFRLWFCVSLVSALCYQFLFLCFIKKKVLKLFPSYYLIDYERYIQVRSILGTSKRHHLSHY